MSSQHVASRRIQEFLGAFSFSDGEQEKESIIRVRVGKKNPYLVITVCHHPASLVMPNGDPGDGYFYPAITLTIDSYNMSCGGSGGSQHVRMLVQVVILCAISILKSFNLSHLFLDMSVAVHNISCDFFCSEHFVHSTRRSSV